MFVDMPWPPEDHRPDPPRRRLSEKEQKVLVWLVGINLVLALVAPIGGATLLQVLIGLPRP